MVYFMENPIYKWMITFGVPRHDAGNPHVAEDNMNHATNQNFRIILLQCPIPLASVVKHPDAIHHGPK